MRSEGRFPRIGQGTPGCGVLRAGAAWEPPRLARACGSGGAESVREAGWFRVRRAIRSIGSGGMLLAWFLLCVGMGGCASAPEVSRGKRMVVRTTAYTHTEPGGESSAVGTRLRFGSDVCSAASDWSWLPVGTRFTVLSTGRVYVIEDYGSALVGRQTIDLYMPTVSMMRNWGVRWEEIEVHEWGSTAISRMLLEKRRDNASVRAMLASMPSANPPIRAQ